MFLSSEGGFHILGFVPRACQICSSVSKSLNCRFLVLKLRRVTPSCKNEIIPSWLEVEFSKLNFNDVQKREIRCIKTHATPPQLECGAQGCLICPTPKWTCPTPRLTSLHIFLPRNSTMVSITYFVLFSSSFSSFQTL